MKWPVELVAFDCWFSSLLSSIGITCINKLNYLLEQTLLLLLHGLSLIMRGPNGIKIRVTGGVMHSCECLWVWMNGLAMRVGLWMGIQPIDLWNWTTELKGCLVVSYESSRVKRLDSTRSWHANISASASACPACTLPEFNASTWKETSRCRTVFFILEWCGMP